MIKPSKVNNTPGDIAVIGGGPSGMMAACAAAQSGARVTLYEQNRILGKKLRITGKGRCNVTNDCAPDEFLRHVTKNEKFLYSAINRFTPADAMSFFETLGVPLKTERGRRVFPVSDRASDIAEAFVKNLDLLGVEICRERVKDIIIKDGEAAGVTAARFRAFNAVIVATGGVSYPLTGSTGAGYTFAEKAGLKVTPRKASLVPIVTKENFSDMAGLSLKNVVLTVRDRKTGKEVFSELGEMLFTHFGVSGPLVLSASSHMTAKDASSYEMKIDLKPALDESELDRRILSDFSKYSNRDFINALGDLLPKNLIPYIVAVSGIPERIKVNSVTKEMRRSLISSLKGMTVTPVSTRAVDEAIVTCGGVDVKELSPKTMESKKVKRLFFAGEVIDVDAYTGGYNLQIAYSTGYLAGESAAKLYGEQNSENTDCRSDGKGDSMKIAIDGLSGVGKSTYAKILAKKHGLVYVDTGALYRAVGLFASRRGADPKSEDEVVPLLSELSVSLEYKDGSQRVIMNGEDVSGLIRTPEISMYASAVSALPPVRQFLLGIQRDMVERGGVIMDGRDIGTVIMPDADVKFFVTASDEVRAERRYKELVEKGVECSYEKILAEIIERDENDRTRDVAPAVPADDAVIIDNSYLTIDETVAEMEKHISAAEKR